MDWFHVLFAAVMVAMVLATALGGLVPGLRIWERFRWALENRHPELYAELSRPGIGEGPGGPTNAFRRMVRAPQIDRSGDEDLIRSARYLRMYPAVYGFMLLAEILILVFFAHFAIAAQAGA